MSYAYFMSTSDGYVQISHWHHTAAEATAALRDGQGLSSLNQRLRNGTPRLFKAVEGLEEPCLSVEFVARATEYRPKVLGAYNREGWLETEPSTDPACCHHSSIDEGSTA